MKFVDTLLVTGVAGFLSGCFAPQTEKGTYRIEECLRELKNDEKFSENVTKTRIVVVKHERRLYLYRNGRIAVSYPVSLGKNPVGHKRKRGDFRTPEGNYTIDRKLCSRKFYRSLHIDYPRPKDIAAARKAGVHPGGAITIHGQPVWNANGYADGYTLMHDWTEGCVAVTNSAMRDLWSAVNVGTPVTIEP
jgi:murein L,D-transpeptidase YafK